MMEGKDRNLRENGEGELNGKRKLFSGELGVCLFAMEKENIEGLET